MADEHGQPPPAAPTGVETPVVLSVAAVAVLLNLNRKTVYEAIARNALPGARRIGRVVRVHRETLLRWLASGGTITATGQGPARGSRSTNR